MRGNIMTDKHESFFIMVLLPVFVCAIIAFPAIHILAFFGIFDNISIVGSAIVGGSLGMVGSICGFIIQFKVLNS